MTRMKLPQMESLFLTDGGLETDLIFNHGVEIPCFAAITLLRTDEGRAALDAYYRRYLDIARSSRAGFILESASWRASPDWAPQLGIDEADLAELNRTSVEMLHALRREHESPGLPIIVSGCIGPRGDGYDPGQIMSCEVAEAYHLWQAGELAAARPDMISAITMTNINEAVGIARAAMAHQLPAVISFTVETDGRLPTGDRLESAIGTVDALTDGYPSYYMINCAHPSHFDAELAKSGAWTRRIGGIRANASRCSHAELDAMTALDAGDPDDLGRNYGSLRRRLPHLNVLGGCCGTDERHVAAIAEACVEPA